MLHMINIPNGKWETNVRPYISLLYNSYLCDVTVPSIKYVTQTRSGMITIII